MFLTQTSSKKHFTNWALFLASLCWVFLLAPNSVKGEESNNNNLPLPPDTGSPEEQVFPGGTRDSSLITRVCGESEPQITYLLGDQNREFTLSAYPTFWFYVPNNLKKIGQIKFTVKNLETDKTIYKRVISPSEMVGITGISIPPEPEYAIAPNVNYSWSLAVDCTAPNHDSVILLEGWLHRRTLRPEVQNQLATVTEAEKHTVYFQHNLLYDALNDLAQLRIAQPNNTQLTTAWNELLAKLGWQNLEQGFKSTTTDKNQTFILKRI